MAKVICTIMEARELGEIVLKMILRAVESASLGHQHKGELVQRPS